MNLSTNPHYREFFESHTVQARIAELQRIRDAYEQKQKQSMLVSLFNKQLLARVLEQIQELVSQARAYVHAQEQAQARALQQAQAHFLAQEEAKALERQNDRKRHADEVPLRLVFKRRQSIRGRQEYSEVAVIYVQQENGRNHSGDDVEELPDLPQRKQQRSRSC